MAYQSMIHSIPHMQKQKNKSKELVYRKIDRSKAHEKNSESFENKNGKKHQPSFHRLDVTNAAKELQYKILQNYIATNKLLYKMKIKPNPRCNFCNLNTQDIAHLFFE